MEIYNKQAHSSLFEDQMAQTAGGRGLLLVLTAAAARPSQQPPPRAASNRELHTRTVVSLSKFSN